MYVHNSLFFLLQHKCFTCLHKYYTLDDWKDFAAKHPEALPYVAISSGIGETDFGILQNVLENIPEIKFICIDVANGYSQFFVEYVKKVRSCYPSHTIMVKFSIYFYFYTFWTLKTDKRFVKTFQKSSTIFFGIFIFKFTFTIPNFKFTIF